MSEISPPMPCFGEKSIEEGRGRPAAFKSLTYVSVVMAVVVMVVVMTMVAVVVVVVVAVVTVMTVMRHCKTLVYLRKEF